MNRMAVVARREYLERVRSRAFLVSTLLGPVLLAGFTILPGVLMQRQRGKPLRVAVVDATGTLGGPVREAIAHRKVNGQARFVVMPTRVGDLETARQAARKAVVDGALDGYLYLPPDALRTSKAEYYGRNVSNMMDLSLLEKAAEEGLVGQRLAGEGLDVERVRSLTRKLDLRTVRLTEKGEREDRGGSFALAMILLTMIYTTVAMWGAAIMNGVIEEKTNRVVEVIVSSVPTSSLFGGKLAGVGAAGLTQFLVWALTMAAIGAYGASTSGATMPELPPLLLVSFVLFFLLGYFLYGSIYAAIGSAVNTQQEAQSLVFPAMMPLIVGFMFFPVVLGSPDGTLSVVLSLIPLFTPLLMFLRITAVTPPLWQIALSIALTAGTIAFTTWGASRIYRVGILMYGKRPTLPEILKWARQG